MIRLLTVRFVFLIAMSMLSGRAYATPDAWGIYVLEYDGLVWGQMIKVEGESFAVLEKPNEDSFLAAHTVNFYPIEQ